MPYIITEPIKISGTRLGYSLYHYQFSFMDDIRPSEEKPVRLKIFQLKESEFNEIDKTLYQKDFSASMQNLSEIKTILKNFLAGNPQYVENLDEMKAFFQSKCVRSK